MSWGITPLGIEIKKRLIDKHMTQVELAKRVGTSKNYISDLIYGKRPLVINNSNILKKISLELEINIDDFKKDGDL